MATKQEQVNAIVAANTDKTRKEVIALIRAATNMTDAGASTYYYNATKNIAKTAKSDAVKESLKATVAETKPDTFVETDSQQVQAEPKAFGPGKTSYNDDFKARQKVAKAQLDEELKNININDIPAFLRKGK